MDAYLGSVGFSGPRPSQIWTYASNTFRANSDSNKRAWSPLTWTCFKDVS